MSHDPPSSDQPSNAPAARPTHGNDACEVCGSDRLFWRSCKLVCANCRSIVKSCADL